MKIASFDQGRIGIIDGDDIIDVSAFASVDAEFWPPIGMVRFISAFDDVKTEIAKIFPKAQRIALTSVRLNAHIQWPNKVIAFPANYHEHVEEMKTGTGLISAFKADGQGFFLKANSSLSGPCDPIILPNLPERLVHHECELAIIIGKGGREISRADALKHIFGYSCLIDVVVRGKEERVMRKSYDTFCPLGPYIVTADEILDPEAIKLELRVNNQIRQSAITRDLIVDIPGMIEMASAVMTLYPGDVIASGTPKGVGRIVGGDVITIDISGVGHMQLDVVQSAGGDHSVWKKVG